MTVAAVDWLPAQALDDPRFGRTFEEPLAIWAERWLGKADAYKFAGFGEIKTRTKSAIPAFQWRRTLSGFCCDWKEQVAVQLALVIVDAQGRKTPRSQTDKALLLELAWDAISDLSSLAADAIGLARRCDDETSGMSPAYKWHLRGATKHYPDIVLGISAPSLVVARKAMIGTEFTEIPSSCSIGDACVGVGVGVVAVLGEANISWGDLEALAVGDVIVIDRQIADTFPLALQKSGAEVCRLILGQHQDSLQLQVA